MAIDPIDFGKVLRPSTVDALNKINELVSAVNNLDPSSIEDIKTDVSTLKTNVTTLQSQLVDANSNISTNATNIATNTTDLEKVKVTLYTPLEQSE